MRKIQFYFFILIAVLALNFGPAFAAEPEGGTGSFIQCFRNALGGAIEKVPTFGDPRKLEALASAALSLKSLKNPKVLSPEILKKLRSLAGVSSDSELLKPSAQEEIFTQLRRKMGDERFESAMGEHLQAVKGALLQPKDPTQSQIDDLLDMKRGWGYRALRENDPVFFEKEYLAKVIQVSGSSGLHIHNGSKLENIIYESYSAAWKEVAPIEVQRPHIFAQTGSDANNLVPDLANAVLAERRNLKSLPYRGEKAEVLILDGAYVSGRGILNTMRNETRVKAPLTKTLDPKDPEEITRLNIESAQSLDTVFRKLNAKDSKVGVIFFEPIIGFNGVLFYPPDFLAALRIMADHFNVALVADEVLTGFGRTGKFCAFQHYPGFFPDYVVTGKAGQLAGISAVVRSTSQTIFGKKWNADHGKVTLGAPLEALLKATQILKRIKSGNLLQNATEVGNYFTQELKKVEILLDPPPPETASLFRPEFRNQGLLINVPKRFLKIKSAVNRLLPPISLTKDEVDQVITIEIDARFKAIKEAVKEHQDAQMNYLVRENFRTKVNKLFSFQEYYKGLLKEAETGTNERIKSKVAVFQKKLDEVDKTLKRGQEILRQQHR